MAVQATMPRPSAQVRPKNDKGKKAALKRQPQCNIQFPTKDNIANPYTKLIEPESLEGEKFKQSFKRINSENEETK
jgi:hypothetical protein